MSEPKRCYDCGRMKSPLGKIKGFCQCIEDAKLKAFGADDIPMVYVDRATYQEIVRKAEAFEMLEEVRDAGGVERHARIPSH